MKVNYVRNSALALILLLVAFSLTGLSMSGQAPEEAPGLASELDNQTVTENPVSQSIAEGAVNIPAPHLRNEGTGQSFLEFKENLARQAREYPDIYFLEAPTSRLEIALTFDDGPDLLYTRQTLDVLEEMGVKATFFLLGENMLRYPDTARRILADGHAVGGHTYNHPDLRTIPTGQAYGTQIEKTQEIFMEIMGIRPAFFRPPYGAITDEQIVYFAEKGIKTVNWSIDTIDWNMKHNSVEELAARVDRYAHEGGIVLMHTGGGNRSNTVMALPVIIQSLRERGYEFKTVPEMLDIEPVL